VFHVRSSLTLIASSKIHRVIGTFLAACFFSAGAFGQVFTNIGVNVIPSPTSGPASSEFTITFTVANSTSVPAENVQLTVSFPSSPSGGSVELVGATPNGCTESSGSLTCSLGTFSGNESQEITLKYKLKDAVGTWTVRGEVSTTTSDNDSANDRATSSIITEESSDLALAASGPTSDLEAGEAFSYQLTITNNGPSKTKDGSKTIVTFTVPNNISLISTSNGWSCSPSLSSAAAGTLVTCTNSSAINSGSTIVMTINAVAMGYSDSSIDASFSVSPQSGWPDPDTTNNARNVSITIKQGSDVSIRKSVVTIVTNGQDQLVYTITPRFEAGDPLDGVTITVTDTYSPDQFTFVKWDSHDGWNCTNPTNTNGVMTFTCTRSGFDGGNFSAMPEIKFTAKPGNEVSASNVASIKLTGREDPVDANNSATATINTSGETDMEAFKEAEFSPIVVDQSFTYTLYARNRGPWRIPVGQAITIDDTLPDGFVLEKAPDADSNYWDSCEVTKDNVPVIDTDYPVTSTTTELVTITCTSTKGLDVGAFTPDVIITVHVGSNAKDIENIACVTLAAKDTNSGWRQDTISADNNCSIAVVTVTVEKADLIVEKTASPDPVNAAEPLTYTITVTNNGPDEATNVVVTDDISSLLSNGGLQSLEITGANGTCSVDGATVSASNFPINGTYHNIQCKLDSLADKETATIKMLVLPVISQTGPRENTAAVVSEDIGDLDHDNNSSTITSNVKEVYDLTVTTWATSAGSRVTSAPANSVLTFTTQVKSLGPSTAPASQVVITLPDNAEFLGLDSTGGGSCSPAVTELEGSMGKTLTCELNSIAANYSRDITYQVMVPPKNPNDTITITSQAEVSLSIPDPPAPAPDPESDPSNNKAEIMIDVTPANADLRVTIFEDRDNISLGEEATYWVTVRNNGASFATSVNLKVDIAKGTATYSYQGNLSVSQSGTCSNEPSLGSLEGSIVCQWDKLSVGDSATISYTLKAESVALSYQSGSIQTTANVSATEDDSTPENNTEQEASTASRAGLGSPGADLAISKIASKEKVLIDEPFDYTITVENKGPEDVTPTQGAQIIDVLPAEVSLISTPTGCSYDDSTRTLVCLIGALANAATFTVTVPVKATVGNGATISNTAIVDMLDDTNPDNNESTATITSGTFTIPTLSTLGLAMLALLMASLAWFYTRRRHQP